MVGHDKKVISIIDLCFRRVASRFIFQKFKRSRGDTDRKITGWHKKSKEKINIERK